MDELDNILEQASALDEKPELALVKPDPGGIRAKRAVKKGVNEVRKVLARRERGVKPIAYDNIEGAAGGRQGLIEVLKFCPESSSAHKSIQKLLVDAALEDINTSLSALCFRHRVRFESLVLAFKEALTAKLAVEALTRLAQNSDEVFEQVSIHALDRFDA